MIGRAAAEARLELTHFFSLVFIVRAEQHRVQKLEWCLIKEEVDNSTKYYLSALFEPAQMSVFNVKIKQQPPRL